MSASRSDIEEAEENAAMNQRQTEQIEEGLFVMVRHFSLLILLKKKDRALVKKNVKPTFNDFNSKSG